MKLRPSFLVAAFVAAGVLLPAAAESFASSASSAGSTSVGSLSDSIGASSDSSTGNKTAAAGDYRVLAIAPMADGRQAVELQAEADPTQRFTLMLPVAAATLVAGERIAVQDRPYGLAFARAQAAEPFYVAVDERWRDGYDLQRVTL